MAAVDLDTPTKRDALESKAEPHWHKISKGQFIGYRKGKKSASWVARAGKRIETIRHESADKEIRKNEYAEVLTDVIAWCERVAEGGNRKYLLSECVSDYISHKKATTKNGVRGWRDAERSLKHHLKGSPMLNTEVRRLTTPQIKKWLHGMVASGDDETVRKSRATSNRVFTVLKAALNMAYTEGVVDSAKAWKRVKPFEDVDGARKLFLTDKQVESLLDAVDGPFHALLKAGVMTGARYGELCNARVMDLDLFNSTLKFSGKTGNRDCYLSKAAVLFFKQQAASKTPNAPLLMSPSGNHWKKWEHAWPLKQAVKRAQLPPEAIFYSLRHYHISKAVGAGLSLLAIAKNCGTSVKMIEKHYGKFQPDNFRAMMDLVELGGVK